jgi:hypothetical protein
MPEQDTDIEIYTVHEGPAGREIVVSVLRTPEQFDCLFGNDESWKAAFSEIRDSLGDDRMALFIWAAGRWDTSQTTYDPQAHHLILKATPAMEVEPGCELTIIKEQPGKLKITAEIETSRPETPYISVPRSKKDLH